MIAFAAIALPIVLALMGIALSVMLPTSGRARWVWLASFLIVGLVGLVAISTGIEDRRESDARQGSAQADIKGLREAVEQLTKPLQPTVRAAHDPDALYQNGNGVGKVRALESL